MTSIAAKVDRQAEGRERTAWSRALRWSAFAACALALLGALGQNEFLTAHFARRQDLPVIVGLFAFWLLLAGSANEARNGRLERWNRWPVALVIAAAVALVGAAGHWLVMHGYALSRDEQMALFDARVFASGRLAAPIDAAFASRHAALNTEFVPVAMRGEGWVSSYRPVNGAFHAAFLAIGLPVWLLGPLMTAAGLLATFAVTRRLVPGDGTAPVVAAVLYAASAQALANAMTPYAMPQHLALNMIWLALLLRDRWWSHAAALGIGFLAVGLHQVIYHPLFAAPVLFFALVWPRRWTLTGVYLAAYAAFGLFWIGWAAYPFAELGVTPTATDGDAYVATRLSWAFAGLSPDWIAIKAANLARFVAWQHALLLPLAGLGAWAAWRRREPMLLALVATIAVIVIAKLGLRPYQGHGWGYRYMHGVIGAACVLGAAGWSELRRRGLADARAFALATALTLGAAAPWLLGTTRAMVGAYAGVDAAIEASGADIVVVNARAAAFANDLVTNPPDLDEPPIRLLAAETDAAFLAKLCATRDVGFVGADALAPINDHFGVEVAGDPERFARLRRACPTSRDISTR